MKIKLYQRLSSAEKQQIENVVEKTFLKRAPEGEKKYEFISRQAAKISRLRLYDLTNEEKVVLRFYGIFGRAVNKYTHRLFNEYPSLKEPTFDMAIASVQKLSRTFDITKPKDVFEMIMPFSDYLVEIFEEHDPFLGASITSYLDKIIEKYSKRYNNDGYLYRVGETLHDAALFEAGSEYPANALTPGDVILPPTLWSSSIDDDAVLFRYARHGEAVTKQSLRVDSADKSGARSSISGDSREVLYIIEDNENLQRLDISGFKFSRYSEGENEDQFSSGEHLIKSRTPFRVIAIQDQIAGLERQIIVLRPISPHSIDLRRDAIKDPFSMKPVDPLLVTRLEAEAEEQHENFRPVNLPLVQKLKPIETVKPIGLDSASASVSALSLGELSEGEKQDKTKKKFKEEAEGEGEGIEELAELI